MEKNEMVRATHRPDWTRVFVGVTGTFALMGALNIIGNPLGLLDFGPRERVHWIVAKALWMLLSTASSVYAGAYLMGALLPKRARIPAAMNGLLVWVVSVISFGIVGWFGYDPLPGLSFSTASDATTNRGLIWMAMMFGLPLPFIAAYGAMAGNDLVPAPPAEQEKSDATPEQRAA